jgi:hypothetical protein
MKQRAGCTKRRGLEAYAVVLGAGLVAVACSSSSSPIGGAGGARQTGAGGQAGGIVTLTGSGSVTGTPPSDAAAEVTVAPGSPDADPPLPAALVAESPPAVACTGQVDATVECDLPHSTCALPAGCDADLTSCMSRSNWIVYYENARCVAGRCVWDQSYFQCDGSSRCSQGACIAILGTT